MDRPIICKRCGSVMQLRNGRYGQFFGCTQYPECRSTLDVTEVKWSKKPRKPRKEKCKRESSILEFHDQRLVVWRVEMIANDTSTEPPWHTHDESVDHEYLSICGVLC